MTLDEWADLDEDEEGELVDGRLEEEEMPTWLHEEIVRWLIRTVDAWLAPIGGRIFGSEAKLRVSAHSGRKPDACMYLPGRPLPARNGSSTRRPPSVVIEVLSPRPRDIRRDVIDKMRDYAAFGVPFYWIVDPQARTLEVFELGADGRYAVALGAADGAHAVPGCAGLTLDLDAMWSSADALPEGDEGDGSAEG
jgi:Uma2 family endonuclease